MKANKAKNLKLITPTTLIVGVDGHAKSNTAAFTLASGDEPARPVKFSNDRSGFMQFLDKVNWLKEKKGLDNVLFVLEPNGPYWQLLARFLAERKYPVRVVSPLQVKRNRQTENPSPDKNDSKDARSAADLGRQGKFNQTTLPEQLYEDLRTLTRLRDGLLEERSRQKHRLRAALVRAFPEVLCLFSDICSKGLRSILKVAPTAEAVVGLGVDGVADVLKGGSKGRLGRKKAKQVVELAESSVGYAGTTPALKLEFDVILEALDFLSGQIERSESEMKRLLYQTDEALCLLSIPGIGAVSAAAVLGESGGLLQYENAGQIRKLAGLDLVGEQSGTHQGKLRISKKGRRILRKILYQCAVSSLHCNRTLRSFYDGLIDPGRDNTLKKKQALVAVAGKLVEIMLSLVKTGKRFDPEHKWMAPGKDADHPSKEIAA